MASLGRRPGAAPLTSADIPDNSITAAKIVEGTITVGDIGTDAVGTDEIADDAVTGAKIENNPTIEGNLTVSGDIVPSTPLSHRNLVINGAMTVKQRGDSHSTEGYGSLDRYTMGLSGGSATMSQEDLTLGQSDIPSRFRHYMKLNCTTGNNNCGFYHYIENPSELEGAYVLSFYAKGTNPAAGNFALSVQSSYGTGGSTGVNPYDGTLTVTSSWQRFQIAVTFPSLTGKTVNDADGTTGINIRQGGSDTGTAAWALDITGIQLELGSNATPFEHRSYGEELARCQRYFHKVTGTSITYGAVIGDNYRHILYPFPTTMRATPTVTGVTWSAGSNPNAQMIQRDHCDVYVNMGDTTTLSVFNGITAESEYV